MAEILLPTPHPGQQAVIRGARRFNWLSAGRRWRKTTLFVPQAVYPAVAGKIVLWGAPTYDQVRIGWDETRAATAGVFEFNQGRMEAHYPRTGGRIIYRSLDNPDNARGHTADRVLLDEAAYINPTAYYEVIRQMLMDTGGDFWAGGTPNGQNWFWREHRRAATKPDSACWQIPSLGCEVVNGQLIRKPHPLENPHIQFEELLSIFETSPLDIFKQEIMAEFIQGAGQVFRNLDACMNAPLAKQSDHYGHHICVGIDWGKQSDFTAVSIGCADCRVEVYKDRFNQIDWAFQYGRITEAFHQWGVRYALVETNSIGDPGFEALQRAGLPVDGFQTTASSKPPLIENLALCFERQEFQFQDDPIWTGELEAYRRIVSPTTGRSAYSAPDGMHDDTVMSLAIAWDGATSGGAILWMD